MEPISGNCEHSLRSSCLRVAQPARLSLRVFSMKTLEGSMWRAATLLSPCLAAEKKLWKAVGDSACTSWSWALSGEKQQLWMQIVLFKQKENIHFISYPPPWDPLLPSPSPFSPLSLPPFSFLPPLSPSLLPLTCSQGSKRGLLHLVIPDEQVGHHRGQTHPEPAHH